MSDTSKKLGLQAAWAMAVGGMVGGGIFSTLGVVIEIAGSLAWLSFVVAGVVALLAGYSYSALARRFGEAGGAFTFLLRIDRRGFAGSLAWVLLVGYVLTNAVYAFTFGRYLAHVFELGPPWPRVAALGVLSAFLGINLLGTGEAGGVEVVLVWFKLSVLLALAAVGFAEWTPANLAVGVPAGDVGGALFGAASVFMAYEGFQLLTYDYDDMRDPDRTLPRAILGAVLVVIAVYVVVALGTASLIGADRVVEAGEVSLAVAGRRAAGVAGLWLVTVGAAFSTGSAINATLFATARLAGEVARGGELPASFARRDARGVPRRALVVLASAAGVFAVFGSLSDLVESASLAFLFTFTVVCGLAFVERAGSRWLTGAGALGAGAACATLTVRLVRTEPVALGFMGGVVLLATVVRPWVLRRGRDPPAG